MNLPAIILTFVGGLICTILLVHINDQKSILLKEVTLCVVATEIDFPRTMEKSAVKFKLNIYDCKGDKND